MKKLNKKIISFPNKGVIGCIHAQPLPGSPRYGGNIKSIVNQAIDEAKIYDDFPLAGIIIENMHDVPYNRGFAASETIAAMSVICNEVRKLTKLPLGIQILAGAAVETLSVAVACDLQFLRVEGFSFAHVADEGIIQSCAAELLRKRSELKANHIKIFADIKKKHSSHAITADLDIADVAEATEFMGADGLIVTGKATGKAPDIDELKIVRASVKLPLWIGSGMTSDNVSTFKPHADCLIVGSEFKKDGYWKNELDSKRIRKFIKEYGKANG